jgi:hypothetical protein
VFALEVGVLIRSCALHIKGDVKNRVSARRR